MNYWIIGSAIYLVIGILKFNICLYQILFTEELNHLASPQQMQLFDTALNNVINRLGRTTTIMIMVIFGSLICGIVWPYLFFSRDSE